MAVVLASQRLDIRPTNLYGNGYIVDFPDEGESLLLRDIINFPTDAEDEFYTVIKNERLDLISYAKYKDKIDRAVELWWVIADANGIMNPLDIRDFVGKQLRIPAFKNVIPYL